MSFLFIWIYIHLFHSLAKLFYIGTFLLGIKPKQSLVYGFYSGKRVMLTCSTYELGNCAMPVKILSSLNHSIDPSFLQCGCGLWSNFLQSWNICLWLLGISLNGRHCRKHDAVVVWKITIYCMQVKFRWYCTYKTKSAQRQLKLK